MENYANDAGREFGWDDEIQNDSPDRVVLPEGEYPFEVTKFERQRHPGSAKLPPCAMALLTIQIDGGEKGHSVVTHRGGSASALERSERQPRPLPRRHPRIHQQIRR